jgi:hypothetical protein
MVQHLHRRPVRHIRRGGCYGDPANTVFVIAVMTSLNCGVHVFWLRAVEPNSTGEHAQTYPTLDLWIAARDCLFTGLLYNKFLRAMDMVLSVACVIGDIVLIV